VRCFVVAGFLLTSASRGPSAIAEPLVNEYLETNYLMIHWTDFQDFSPSNTRVFVDDRSEPLF